jgi:hypothetical protein
MYSTYGLYSGDSYTNSMVILASFTGAVSCLFGALTARRFHRTPRPDCA